MEKDKQGLVVASNWATAENLLAGVVQGRYLPTWVWFLKYALFIVFNQDAVKRARLLWHDYVRLLAELEAKNAALYHKWVSVVASKLMGHLTERPSEYATSFVFGRALRAWAKEEAGVSQIVATLAQSTLYLGISAIPKAYLAAVVEASQELGASLARATAEDRMLLRSAVRLARDLLPLATRLADSSSSLLPQQEQEEWPKLK